MGSILRGFGRLAGEEKKIESEPQLLKVFEEILQSQVAGSPMREEVRWTNLKPMEIVRLGIAKGVALTRYLVEKLSERKGLGLRQMRKSKTAKEVPERDRQFVRISQLKEDFSGRGFPVLSIDTKKKEFLGQFYRKGKAYCEESLEVHDHDFPSLAEGVVIPHGIYDVSANTGYISLGKSKDTSEFLCDNLKHYWEQELRQKYPEAGEMLLLMDGGGSNSSLHYIVKEDLQNLAAELGMVIRVAHYPPYCSKYNPIEHRLFPHVQRSWDAVLFSDYEVIKERVEQTTTKTGLKVVAWINEKVYQTGRKYSTNFKETMKIVFDETLPKWNYVINPL